MSPAPLLALDERGLACAAGGFHVDPWKPAPRAVLTHAHADHTRPGSGAYLCAAPGVELVRRRVHPDAVVQGVPYGEVVTLGQARVSFHPAGHVLGSAQVRVEVGGEVWVVTGDYKLDRDPTCAPFESVPCHTLITESTFGLPIYRWDPPERTVAEVAEWWRACQAESRTAVLLVYALGKSQRVLAGLREAGVDLGPIAAHGAVRNFVELYRELGCELPAVLGGGAEHAPDVKGRGLVLAPPSAAGTPFLRKYGKASLALASGWMRVRGNRRRRALDRGFVLSDHADWPSLLQAVEASGAERVLVTHGFQNTLVRHLRDRGLQAERLDTQFGQEEAEERAAQEVEA